MLNFYDAKPHFHVEMTEEGQDKFTLVYEKNQINTRQLDIMLKFIESKQTMQNLHCLLKLLFIAINDPNNDLTGSEKVVIENWVRALMMLQVATPNN